MSCLANVPLWAKIIPAFIHVQSLENEPYTYDILTIVMEHGSRWGIKKNRIKASVIWTNHRDETPKIISGNASVI